MSRVEYAISSYNREALGGTLKMFSGRQIAGSHDEPFFVWIVLRSKKTSALTRPHP
jgi:hypothetical protein